MEKNQENFRQDQLKRNILEDAIRGQEQTKSSQAELDIQGKKLKTSVKDIEVIADQTIKTGRAVDNLLFETKANVLQRIFKCCCCSCYGKNKKASAPLVPLAIEDDEEQDVNLHDLKVSKRKPSWKKTLAATSNNDIWYRQIDTSLSQLQLAAEEMSESLDEQLRLAQILTIYINYGVDKVLNLNKNIA